jgi:hypothetical protein
MCWSGDQNVVRILASHALGSFLNSWPTRGSWGHLLVTMSFLSAIEKSDFATWVREGSSVFGYYGFLFLHTVGLATVVGLSAMIDFRLLGFARRLPLVEARV